MKSKLDFPFKEVWDWALMDHEMKQKPRIQKETVKGQPFLFTNSEKIKAE